MEQKEILISIPRQCYSSGDGDYNFSPFYIEGEPHILVIEGKQARFTGSVYRGSFILKEFGVYQKSGKGHKKGDYFVRFSTEVKQETDKRSEKTRHDKGQQRLF